VTDPVSDEALLALLNTTPVVDGRATDLLADDAAARTWLREHGGRGTAEEADRVRAARDVLQAVVRGAAPATAVGALLEGVRQAPRVGPDGVAWELEVDEDRRLAAGLVLAWGRVAARLPGRLRPCANGECHLFLLDRSRAGAARWCSMRSCGNRLKARRHQERRHQEPRRAPE
jgi:predicted RNA-binding Zn ribbon-like protein